MSDITSYDTIVIGGGPGGYVAAIRAAQLGQKVACVEREALGGVCLNWGCIPTKSLLRNSELASILTNEAKEFGFSFDNLKLDYAVAQKRSRQVSERLVKGIGFLFKKNGVTHIQGTATLVSSTQVRVAPSGELLTAKAIIIATGARPRKLPLDGVRIVDLTQVWAGPFTTVMLAELGAVDEDNALTAIGRELAEGDEILISKMEHHSNIIPWQMACAATGATLRYIGVTDDGRLDLADLGSRDAALAATR